MQKTIKTDPYVYEDKDYKGDIILVKNQKGDGCYTLERLTIESYNEDTGKIIGKKVDVSTVGNPNPKGKEIMITHKNDVISWL